MQSFFQYRRFGKAVKAQYERNQAKISRGERIDSSHLSPSTQFHAPTTDAQDLEKGQPENEDSSGSDGRPLTAIPSEGTLNLNLNLNLYHEITRDGGMQAMKTIPTQKSMGTKLGTAMTGIDVWDKAAEANGDGGKFFVVGYERSDDPLNPHNWSFVTRMGAT